MNAAATPDAPLKVLGPDSLMWRDFGTYRYILMLPQAFVLQSAHPVINSAITQGKKYKVDPWGRARDSVALLWPIVYSRPQAARDMAHRLRELHRGIKGVDKHGKQYHGLDPEAYSWVHITGYDAILRLAEIFGKKPDAAERAQLFAEWQQMGRMLGIHERYIPSNEEAYWAYFHKIIDERLVWDESVTDLMDPGYFQGFPKPEQLSWLPEFAWQAIIRPVGWVGHKVCLVTLPERFRDKFGLRVTALDRVLVAGVAAVTKIVHPMLPHSLRYIPKARHAFDDAKQNPELYAQA